MIHDPTYFPQSTQDFNFDNFSKNVPYNVVAIIITRYCGTFTAPKKKKKKKRYYGTIMLISNNNKNNIEVLEHSH